MANNCYNYLEISGSEEDIKKLEECIKSDDKEEIWDLRKIIPVEIDDKGFFKIKGSIYDLWGTKWFSVNGFDNNGDKAYLSFDTAWSPSLPITLEMSKRFNLKINHYYEESGCAFEGDYDVDNGKVTLNNQREYRPRCYRCEEKFYKKNMIYKEDEGEYYCKRCGDEFTALVMDKIDMIKEKKKDGI